MGGRKGKQENLLTTMTRVVTSGQSLCNITQNGGSSFGPGSHGNYQNIDFPFFGNSMGHSVAQGNGSATRNNGLMRPN